jgi:hypothetical protein
LIELGSSCFFLQSGKNFYYGGEVTYISANPSGLVQGVGRGVRECIHLVGGVEGLDRVSMVVYRVLDANSRNLVLLLLFLRDFYFRAPGSLVVLSFPQPLNFSLVLPSL